MEKIMIVLNKGTLQERKWTTSQGEQRTISTIELELSDGFDTVVAEATDALAAKIAAKDFGSDTYLFQLRLQTRAAKTDNGQPGRKFISCRIINIGGLS